MDRRGRLRANSPQETRALGRCLGKVLFDGAVVGLSGPLGVGKTALARGVAEGMGIEKGYVVSSPTYTIMQSYPCADRDLHHLDLFRIGSAEDLDATGYRDCMAGRAVLLVEWPEKEPSVLPPQHLLIKMDYSGNGRDVVLEASGHTYEELLGTFLSCLSSITMEDDPS